MTTEPTPERLNPNAVSTTIAAAFDAIESEVRRLVVDCEVAALGTSKIPQFNRLLAEYRTRIDDRFRDSTIARAIAREVLSKILRATIDAQFPPIP